MIESKLKAKMQPWTTIFDIGLGPADSQNVEHWNSNLAQQVES